MARRMARIKTSIWDPDSDFRLLSAGAQRAYNMLLSQANLSQAGTLPLTLRRWAAYAADTTVESVTSDLHELDEQRYVIVDFDTEELLIRTFIRNDEVYKQPNVMVAAAAAVELVSSPRLRAVLADELRRLPEDDIAGLKTSKHGSVLAVVQNLIATLEKGSSNPSSNPSGNPSSKGSANPCGNPSGGLTGRVTESDTGSENTQQEPFREGLPQGFQAPSGEDLEESLRISSSGFPLSTNHLPLSTTSSSDAEASDKDRRRDVEELCSTLQRLMVDNGCRRPTISKSWRDEARRLLDRDGVALDDAMSVLTWCQNDSFWKSNIQSMPKFREQFDKLRLRSTEQRAGNGHPPYRNVDHWSADQEGLL